MTQNLFSGRNPRQPPGRGAAEMELVPTDDLESAKQGYRWESDYDKTWEAIQENEDGTLRNIIDFEARRKRRKEACRNVRLGLMRHMFIVLDFSEAMTSKIKCALKILELFLSEFSGLNPISQIGIILTRDKRFELLSSMSSDMRAHMMALEKLRKTPCTGEPSLQNSLEATLTTLKHMPSHTSKEVLVIMGSLTTCDPGDIHATIQSLASHNIRCSVVGLAAEVKVCKTLVEKTRGTYDVVLDDTHFKSVVFDHLNPPPAKKGTHSSLIRMGFSQYIHDDRETPAMCACHPGDGTNFSHHGYFCPQCQAKYCDLPIGCHVCGLTLVSAAHLARSFHHLFPVEMFKEVEPTLGNGVAPEKRKCFACTKQVELEKGDASQCTSCKSIFCLNCDIFIHEQLHFCPACPVRKAKTSAANKNE